MILPWKRTTLSLLSLLWVTPCVDGYSEYQARIPNGARVPHPCKDRLLWPGVGHYHVQGGGPRNQFGQDFAAAGRTWTTDLCRKDSDGDGKSNGEELGDPQCTWTPGEDPQSTIGITHPGVCDPYQEAACSSRTVSNSSSVSYSNGVVSYSSSEVSYSNGGVSYSTVGDWMKEACREAEFECPAVDREGVQHMDFRLPLMSIPGRETTYICMTYEWPDVSKDYHIIATEPIINNTNVLHHMLLLGCPDDYVGRSEGPWECNMPDCKELVSSWGVGLLGHCFHEDAGILAGRSGYSKFMVQVHWNNPLLHGGLADSSGLRLHYTPRLRPYNMAMLWTGQLHLHIPPNSPHTAATSDCTPTCTRTLMSGDIHITSAVNHMHYLGKSMNIELHRGGRFLMNLTDELSYKFDAPKFYEYPDVVTVKPGDMIRTNCHYSSLNKSSPTFYGLGTSDEMCFGFLTFYPKENMPHSLYCVSWKGFMGCDHHTYGQCSMDRRLVFTSPAFEETPLFHNITSACQPGVCSEQCERAVRFAHKCDPCLSNAQTWGFIRWHRLPLTEAGSRFAASLESCATELQAESLTRSDPSHSIVCPEDRTSAGASAGRLSSGCWLGVVVVGLFSGTLCLTLLMGSVRYGPVDVTHLMSPM